MYDFLSGDKSNFGLFFSYLFSVLILIAAIIFLNFSPWLIIVNILALIFYSYFVSFNITCIIILYPIGGILNTILILIPCGCILTFCILLISAVAIKRNLLAKKYGCEYVNKCQSVNYVKVYSLLILGCIVALFVMCLFLPLAKATIIVT